MPVWSEVSQSYWNIPDYSDYNVWAPNQEDALYMIGIAIGLTLLRVQVQRHFAQVRTTRHISVELVYFSQILKFVAQDVETFTSLPLQPKQSA
jgi:hypothetical protein